MAVSTPLSRRIRIGLVQIMNQMNKIELRKIMNRERESLSEAEVEEKSREIYKNLLKNEDFTNAGSVLCYINIRNEVITKPILDFCFEHNIKIAVPRVNGNEMDFYYISSYSELTPGAFGIPEPVGNNRCIPKGNDVIIMPGLAFDKKGNRIGYGGGYYDKYLSIYHIVKKIAVAYDFQIVDEVESEITDILPDCIVTERGIYFSYPFQNNHII